VTHGLGLAIESLVALLLLLTIGYCLVLNRRLKRFKTDELAMRTTILELVAATEKAERAIGGLKLTVQESDRTLGERLRTAERLSAALDQQIASGERLVAAAAPPARAPQPRGPDARAVVAAAQAFAERARARYGRAA